MALVVAASNVLVQYPASAIGMADYLTWGAFTYPAAFLVTDLTNRRFGPAIARRVVMAGFAVAVLLSILLSNPRIALASGTAFLVAQMLDITVFDRLRRMAWWRAPLASSLIGSAVDTALFFSLAFSASFSVFGYEDAFALEAVSLLGIGGESARWVSWALADFGVKILCAGLMLLPYGLLLGWIRARDAVNGTA